MKFTLLFIPLLFLSSCSVFIDINTNDGTGSKAKATEQNPPTKTSQPINF